MLTIESYNFEYQGS